jgi:hypothetical protein
MIDINASRKSNGVGTHDQIIHFINGEKRVIQGVSFIWENRDVHIVDYLGVEYIVNRDNVLFVERISRGGEGNGTADESGSERSREHQRRRRKTSVSRDEQSGKAS